MDFTGLGKFTAYKTNRPLGVEEVEKQLDKNMQASLPPTETISIIKINSVFLEIVDRWYPSKGWGIWVGGPILISLLWLDIAVTVLAVSTGEWMIWLVTIGTIIVTSPLIFFGWYGCRLENFRQTHYPVRLNRKTRKVYAFRPRRNDSQGKLGRSFFVPDGKQPDIWKNTIP